MRFFLLVRKGVIGLAVSNYNWWAFLFVKWSYHVLKFRINDDGTAVNLLIFFIFIKGWFLKCNVDVETIFKIRLKINYSNL